MLRRLVCGRVQARLQITTNGVKTFYENGAINPTMSTNRARRQ
jgi:hypothetical protein